MLCIRVCKDAFDGQCSDEKGRIKCKNIEKFEAFLLLMKASHLFYKQNECVLHKSLNKV